MKRADRGAERLCRAAIAAALLALCLPVAWGSGQHNAPRPAPRPHYAAPRVQNERPRQIPGPRSENRPGLRNESRQGLRNEGRGYGQSARPYGGYRMAPGPGAGRRMVPRTPNSYGTQGMQYRGPDYVPRAANPAAEGNRFRAPYNGAGAQSFYARPGHLGSWLNQNRGIPLQQQEKILRKDPSFNRLPQATQQRLVQQLHQVDQMPEAQRERRLARAENLERMTPQERAQVQEAGRRWTQLPTDRQTAMRSAFRDLRGVPPDQRQTVLNSGQYQRAFSPEERGILSKMLSVEPYEPPQK